MHARILLVLALALFALGGCKKADVEDAPDADVPCNAGPHVFCDAGVPVDQGCTAAPGDPDKRIGQMTPGTYPVGCTANFVGDSRDVGGDCRVEAICKCMAGVDGGTPATTKWMCFP